LMGYGEEQRPESAIHGLITGLRRALDLHEARSLWERFDGMDWGVPPVYRLNTLRGPGGACLQETFNAGVNRSFTPNVSAHGLRRVLAAFFTEYLQDDSYF